MMTHSVEWTCGRSGGHTSKNTATRVARAQATKSARAAHLISASNYGYVLHDLRLTGILAAIMLVGMIVLKIVLR